MEIRHKRGKADARMDLGIVFHLLEEYQKAEECYERALAIRMEIKDKSGEAKAYADLGTMLFSLSEYQKAKEYHEKALRSSWK